MDRGIPSNRFGKSACRAVRGGRCGFGHRSTEGASFEDYATGDKIGKSYWGNSHTHLIADFYARLIRGEQPCIPPEDGMETTRLMEQAYRSASQIRRRPE